MKETNFTIMIKIQKAYLNLLQHDVALLRNNANERSITHKLATYLQDEFPEWDVDCEYNRNQIETKRLKHIAPPSAQDTDAHTVYPDIIVHRRETNDNLLIIEAKKDSFCGKDYDAQKLKLYCEQLHYLFACKITFPTGKKLSPDIFSGNCINLQDNSHFD